MAEICGFLIREEKSQAAINVVTKRRKYTKRNWQYPQRLPIISEI